MYKCKECGAICKSVYDLLLSERNCPLDDKCVTQAEMYKVLAPILRDVDLPDVEGPGFVVQPQPKEMK